MKSRAIDVASAIAAAVTVAEEDDEEGAMERERSDDGCMLPTVSCPAPTSAEGGEGDEAKATAVLQRLRMQGAVAGGADPRTKIGKSKKKASVSSMINEVFYITTQEQVAGLEEKLSGCVRELDVSVRWRSEVRAEADQVLEELRAVQELLLNAYVETEAHVEKELLQAQLIDEQAGRISVSRLQAAIAAARHKVGARTLLGDVALRAAEAAGCGLKKGIREPDNPWARLVRQPPWEATFMSALRMLIMERHRQHLDASGGMHLPRRMLVTVVGARNLRNADWELEEGNVSDPYCVVEVRGRPETRRTSPVIENSLNPVWDWTSEFSGFTVSDVLIFAVWDKDEDDQDELLGRAQLSGLQILAGASGELKLTHAGKVESYLSVRAEFLQ